MNGEKPVKLKTRTGMTILELLVVIAVLGIFMGIAIPSVMKSFTLMARAKKSAARYPDVRRALGAMSDTIRQAYTAAEAGTGLVGRDGSYEAAGIMLPADEMHFFVLDSRYSRIGSVQEIDYALQLNPAQGDSERGVVQSRSPLSAPDAGIREALLPEAVALDFRYLDNSQKPPAWVQEWPPKKANANIPYTAEAETASPAAPEMPAAVEITVYLLGGASSQPSPFRAVVNLPSQR
jgi:prepilin-type N-terminal cleavage/methylation domain-containing protein